MKKVTKIWHLPTWVFSKRLDFFFKKSWTKIFWNAIFSKQTQWQDVVGWWWDEKNRSPNFYWFMSSKNIFEFCVGKEIKFQARYIPNIKIGIYFFLADIFKWLCYKLTLNNYYFSLQTPLLGAFLHHHLWPHLAEKKVIMLKSYIALGTFLVPRVAIYKWQ